MTLSFSVPKIEAKCSAIVLGALQRMLKLHKTKIRTASEILIQNKRIYVLKKYIIGFSGKNREQGILEYLD